MNQLRKDLLALDLPVRAINVICNMVTDGESWSDIVEDYKADPQDFDIRFLRTPGGGRASLNAVKAELDKHLQGFDRTGRIAYLTAHDRQRALDALEEAAKVCGKGGSLARELDTVRGFFAAETIRILR
jgi:hypothetical protein